MGLDSNATPKEIKSSYRKLARKYHPDVSKDLNAEEKFKELGEAYEVLKDPEKRAEYDQQVKDWANQKQGNYDKQQPPFSNEDEINLNDIFGSIFSKTGRNHANQYYKEPSQDIHAKMTISLEDSFHGVEKIIQLQIPNLAKNGKTVNETRAVKVKIPKGVVDKQQIRLKGLGGKVNSNEAGNLYIELNIAKHPWYKFNDKDIYLDVPITPWESALGSKITVPTLGGNVSVTIQKLSQTGKQMRLQGRGLPGENPGNQYITLKIVNQEDDNEEMNKLYSKMSEISDFEPRKIFGVSNG